MHEINAGVISLRWNEGSIGDWNALIAQAYRPALNQSWAYAVARNKTERWLPQLGRFYRRKKLLGGVLLLKRQSLGVSATLAERGPFWLQPPEEMEASLLRDCFMALREAMPRSIRTKSRLYADLPAGGALEAVLQEVGFRQKFGGYETLWLDLRPDEALLRKGLRANWRRAAEAGLRAGLAIETDGTGLHLPWLAQRHLADMKKRRYRGPGDDLLVELAKGTVARKSFYLVRALHAEEPVAAALFIRHGPAATYLIGWSDRQGKTLNAQHAILWDAIRSLKRDGVKDLDLGGINATTPGITYFKAGTGASPFKAAGIFV